MREYKKSIDNALIVLSGVRDRLSVHQEWSEAVEEIDSVILELSKVKDMPRSEITMERGMKAVQLAIDIIKVLSDLFG